jgi:hypothetical protein
LPKKRVHFVAAVPGRADDLTASIDGIGHTASVAFDGAEVVHHSVVPEKRVNCLVRSARPSDNLARIIQPCGGTEGPSQCAQVSEMGMSFWIPYKRMEGGISRKIGLPNNLSLVVNDPEEREPANAAKRAQVDDPALFPEERILWWDILSAWGFDWARSRTGVGNTCDLAALVHGERKSVGSAQVAQVSHRPLLPQEGPRLCSPEPQGPWKRI